MTVEPEVSVIMANYNGRRYLEEAIRSLQAQTLDNWELVLVDDASRDESVEFADALAREDSRIVVIAQSRNRGPAAARNVALARVRGPWIAVFDSDDVMRPSRLQMLRERALHDGAAVVADNLLLFSDGTRGTKPFLPHRVARRPRWFDLAEFIDSNRLYSRVPNLGFLKPLIRTEVLRRNGITYDEHLTIGEDYALMVRLLACGFQLRLEPCAHYLYRKHALSISHRLSERAIVALLAADARFARERTLDDAVVRALRRRRRSLESMLRYERVIRALKDGRYGTAAGAALASPRVWPLLTQPVAVRVRRIAAAASMRMRWLQSASGMK